MKPNPFVGGTAYKHRRGTDVAMVVVKVSYRGPDYVKLRVRWWNLQSRFWCSEVTDTVRVQRKDIHDWNRISL